MRHPMAFPNAANNALVQARLDRRKSRIDLLHLSVYDEILEPRRGIHLAGDGRHARGRIGMVRKHINPYAWHALEEVRDTHGVVAGPPYQHGTVLVSVRFVVAAELEREQALGDLGNLA